jgi:FHS family L-fucose permease-like MFS transporter
VQHAFVLPLACYAYIVFYGLRGSRVPEAIAPATGGQAHA